MTENEEKIIKRINNLSGDYKCYDEKLTHEEALLLSKLLSKIQQYRNIGTIEECEEAIEKQQAMEVKEVLLPNGRTGYECGYCGNEIEVNMFHCEYCHWCGQKIDW